jgi:predicted nucleic acid-binding Zn ribbon protein
LTNNALNVKTRFALSVALCLYRSDNLIAYDGNHTHNLQIPILDVDDVDNNKQSKSHSSRSGSDNIDQFIVPDNIVFSYLFDNCDYISSRDVIRHIGGYVKYDYPTCLEIAKKYKSYSDICKFETGMRSFLFDNNLVDQFISDAGFAPRQIYKPQVYKKSLLTSDVVFQIASKFEHFSDFRAKHKNMVKFAIDNNIVNDLRSQSGNFLYMPLSTCQVCNNSFRSIRGGVSVNVCSTKCKNDLRSIRRRQKKAKIS